MHLPSTRCWFVCLFSSSEISQFEVTEPSRYSLSAVSRNVREINGFPLSDAAVVAISDVHLVFLTSQAVP